MAGKRSKKKGHGKSKTTTKIPQIPILNSGVPNHLLGSSADTTDTISDQDLNSFTNKINKQQKHYDYLMHPTKNQAYSMAALKDDIAEEVALLNSNGHIGHNLKRSVNASYNQSSSSCNSATGTQSLQSTNESSGYEDDYNSPDDVNSMFSEVSDSLLLLEERERHASITWHKRPSIMMISLMMFLYTFSIGVSMSADLKLTTEGVCYLMNGSLINCDSHETQQLNASLLKWNNFISSIIKILVSVKMGKLSDIYGRKPMFLFVFMMTGISKLLMIFILTPQYFSFGRVILGNAIESTGGSIFVLLGLANSYTIDVVHDHQRLQALGKLTGALFLGLSLGPLVSSFLGASANVSNIELIGLSAFLVVLSTAVVLLYIPESRSVKLRSKSRRASIRSRKELQTSSSFIYKAGLSPLVDSFQSLKLLWITRPKGFGSSVSDVSEPQEPNELDPILVSQIDPKEIDISARVNALLLLSAEILINVCSVGASLPIALYLMYQFDFEQSQLGLFVGVAAGTRSAVLTIFNPWFQHQLLEYMHHDKFNVDFIDVTSISFAIICELIAAVFCSLNTKFYTIVVYVILAALSAIASPVIHSSLLKYNVNQGKNGEFFGSLALIRNLVNLVAPWLFLTVYSFGVGINHPQAIFYVIALLFFIALVLMGNLRFKAIFD